jgi:16S rRNA A1518/A1519 N6-dimethyltransferase RsmA/KsgA/DIM1 with predicted DNA glycosylase/AP lyase activity
VNAALVTFIPRSKPLVDVDFKILEKVVKAIFQYKHKHWIKGFETLFPKKFPRFNEIFNEKCSVDQKKEPIHLSIEEINDICLVYKNILDICPNLKLYDHRNNNLILN